ncbi:MAG: glycoside hydrolase family 38 C-terminal domain-containing protein, partial [Acidimicrobiales bacterium]
MLVTSAESTELFVGPPDTPLQLVRISFTGCGVPTLVQVTGDGLVGEALATPGEALLEVPVHAGRPVAGQRRAGAVVAGDRVTPFTFTVAEPGWTMFMISHFHYDPVWWNTQAAYTSVWHEEPPGAARQTNGFELVRAHLEMARRDPQYKFVLAEVDYLKPYWDTYPEDRADVRRLVAEGRVEVMGGAYNEPNTNLTSPETTIRNFVHGMGFQRDVLGANPATAWQLDVFGHDPQFPGMASDAGLTSSSWARGPHHQWGPMAGDGDPERMQFSSEFEWIAPSGHGLLTHYMPAHYSAGWWMDSSTSLAAAEEATYHLFCGLRKVASTRNVLLPVGTDYTPPNKWVTEIHRDWGSRYTWPRFVCALPREFFEAVHAEMDAHGMRPSPQTRDMNPIYTGKDVSYIDTKQANRAAEHAVLDAERFAVFAGLLAGATYPQAALAKAWVQLAYGAHHDAITGSESDQVYLDLLTGWRDAWELGCAARDNSLALLSGAVTSCAADPTENTVVTVVWNPLAHNRTDIVTAYLDTPLGVGVRVLDVDGTQVPAHVEHGGRSVTWLASDVPSLGWRSYRLAATDAPLGWTPAPGVEIANEHYRLRVDPARGGGVSSLVEQADGRELIAEGRVGNELAVYEEYSAHPSAGEGPWHLLPKGPVVGSSEASASEVTVHAGRLGERLVVRGRIGDQLRYTQTLTLWRGVARVDCRTTIDEFTGADRLLRLRWPC